MTKAERDRDAAARAQAQREKLRAQWRAKSAKRRARVRAAKRHPVVAVPQTDRLVRSTTDGRYTSTDPATARPRKGLGDGLAPPLSTETAHTFVLLLQAGVPQRDALKRIDLHRWAACREPARAKWLTAWLNDPAAMTAAVALNGGAWETLAADRRLEVALDKHYAELAHFLYAHDFATLDGTDLKKAETARQAIVEKLAATDEGRIETAFTTFMRELVDGKAKGALPPQLTTLADEIAIPMAPAQSTKPAN